MKNKCHIAVTSNFSFSHNVFRSYISLVCQNAILCGNELNVDYQRCETHDHVTSLDISPGEATLDFESGILSFFFVPKEKNQQITS